MPTLETELAKADLVAKRYVRGPGGKAPFVISIQDGPASPTGIFRTWQGEADFDVTPDKRQRQAVIAIDEPAREIRRLVRMNTWSRSSPKLDAALRGIARDRFPINMGNGRIRWRYQIEKAEPTYRDADRWILTVAVTAIAPAQEQTLLCGMDETHYFVSALPERVESVSDAHELLRPIIARREGTQRQGEFFFIPVSERLSRELFKHSAHLRYRPLEGHSSHRGTYIWHGPKRYAIGVVTDERKGRHAPLVLTDWHHVVRNRETQIADTPRRRSWD